MEDARLRPRCRKASVGPGGLIEPAARRVSLAESRPPNFLTDFSPAPRAELGPATRSKIVFAPNVQLLDDTGHPQPHPSALTDAAATRPLRGWTVCNYRARSPSSWSGADDARWQRRPHHTSRSVGWRAEDHVGTPANERALPRLLLPRGRAESIVGGEHLVRRRRRHLNSPAPDYARRRRTS